MIAEGLVMYLAAEARHRLFAKVRQLAERSGELHFVFDLVPSQDEPEPGRVGRVLEAAMKRFTGGRGFERDARTRADVVAELRAAGFDTAEVVTSSDVASAWKLPDPDQRTTMIVFTCSVRRDARSTPR